MKNNDYLESSRCMLIVGHPGHELRVLGWVQRLRPIVVALTDGSGNTGKSRLDISRAMLTATGGTPSSLYGMTSDREIYSKIFKQDFDFFLGLSDSIARLLIEQRTEVVVGDAIEGYNPSHDLCRLIIDRAIRLVKNELNWNIKNYVFALKEHPHFHDIDSKILMIELSPDELALKFSEAIRYADIVKGTLGKEILESIEYYGEDIFSKEGFSCQNSSAVLNKFDKERPYYESYGEQQVNEGFYKQAIYYSKHIAPIARALSQ